MQSTAIEEMSASTPPVTNVTDAEVDIEVLRVIPKQFAIVDEKSANWLVRKIVSARQYAATVALWAELEKRRAQREETCLMFLFGRQIETWTRSEIEKRGGKKKSVALPAGTVGFRAESAKLVVDDDDAVLIWARKNLSGAIQIQEKLMKSVLNQHFESTGEIPDGGAHIEPARERFSIR